MNRRVNLFSHDLGSEKRIGLCTVRKHPTETAVLLFLSLMSAALHNQFPLLTTLST